MTETASTPAAASTTAKKANGKGLKINRIFTREGVHPYDDVTWERRDVVMTNWRDGSVNFEQRGVEFPESWSVNASNIVTTKYFRGAVNTDVREWSLKQVIDRVVDTYTAAGIANGYFASQVSAPVFAELARFGLRQFRVPPPSVAYRSTVPEPVAVEDQ